MYNRCIVLAFIAFAAAKKGDVDPKECEVCISNLEAIDKLIAKDEKTSKTSIYEAIGQHCGDLQNQKPNPALTEKDRKMCYYFEPIKNAITQPFSLKMPKDRVCKKLSKENSAICEIRHPVKMPTENTSPEETMAKLKKMRVKELKGILSDRGVDCDGCLEKEDYIKRVVATQHMDL